MPFRPKDSPFFKTRITLDDGRTGIFACGTTSEEVALDVERMVKTFEHDRKWTPLKAIFDKKAKLGAVYDAHKAGKLSDLLADLESADLSRLVADWPAKTMKYRKQVRCLIPENARFPVQEFNKMRIAEFLDGLTVSGSTKNRYHAALSAFGKWLSRKNYIPSNIVRDVERASPNKVTPRFLDRVEAKALIGALPLPYRAIEALMAATGVEWQVIERLTRRDIDLKKRTVHARGGKNEWRDRVVRPTELWAWKIFAEFVKPMTENAPVFPLIREDTALRVHKSATAAVRLRHTTLHDWRHTYAVQALRDGYSLQVVAHQLGHKDTTLVQSRYGRFVPKESDYTRHVTKPLSKPKAKKRALLHIA